MEVQVSPFHKIMSAQRFFCLISIDDLAITVQIEQILTFLTLTPPASHTYLAFAPLHIGSGCSVSKIIKASVGGSSEGIGHVKVPET